VVSGHFNEFSPLPIKGKIEVAMSRAVYSASLDSIVSVISLFLFDLDLIAFDVFSKKVSAPPN